MQSGDPDPRTPREILASIQPPSSPATSPGAAFGRLLLQDWAPVARSLEWVLGAHFWETKGLDAFVRGEVPYVINNTSWVAESAGAVLLASCKGLAPASPIRILELGAGLGLFARQLLDTVREVCARDGRSEYDRMTYYVTDGSPQTVKRWSEVGLFAEHLDHVVLAVCDAGNPERLRIIDPWEPDSGTDGTPSDSDVSLPGECLQAIFANYILDSLPATILRRAHDTRGSDEFQELRIRTYLSEAHRTEIRLRFGLEWEEVARLARTACSGNLSRPTVATSLGVASPVGTADDSDTTTAAPPEVAAARDKLFLALPYFEFEVDYGPLTTADQPIPPDLRALSADRIVWNYGALATLERGVTLLERGGFILLRDLGPADDARTGDLSYVARFGPSLAFTVAFSVLDAFAERLGARSLSADGDADRTIHTRLILRDGARANGPGPHEPELRKDPPGTDRLGDSTLPDVFRSLFGDDRYGRADALSEEATRHVNAGRYEDALRCYRESLELCPNDWHLLGQAAQFLTQQLFRPEEATELVQKALAVQPRFSAFLWNTLGNCRFYLGDHEAAHDCYLQARAIHPADAQTELNLAYSLASFGHLEEALLAIARGLAYDRDERFEAALLAKQKELIAAVQKRRQDENERLDRRHRAFSEAR